MPDPQNDQPSALLRMAMRLYNSGYHAGHHDTVESRYVNIHGRDMENYHEDQAHKIVQDFLGSNLTDADLRDMQTIFDDTPLPLAERLALAAKELIELYPRFRDDPSVEDIEAWEALDNAANEVLSLNAAQDSDS